MCNQATGLTKLRTHTVAATAATVMIMTAASQASASQIDQVSISGQFSDGSGHVYNMPNTFFDFGSHILDFGGQAVAFDIEFLRTDQIAPDHYSDVVKISYSSLFGTGFLANPAFLEFDGHFADGKSMPIDLVIDYTQAGLFNAGWILNSTLPSNIAAFHTQEGGLPLTNGAPNSSFFTLDYSYVTPIPAALPLLITGLGALGVAGWRKRRASDG
jgi:hypothetical protein